MTFRFHKMHGLGNDFVVVDARETPVMLNADRVRTIADRHRGVGCDQLILIGSADDADVSMRIWNADGSEVSACGNATRCVPVLLGRDVSVRTAAGVLDTRLAGSGATVDMGRPRFEWDAIPLAYPLDTAALPTGWDGLDRPGAVNVGNPHLVFRVADVDAVMLGIVGPTIETDPLFPERINVNIVSVLAPDRGRMRTWERGAGLTRACGTGACATFAVGRRLKWFGPCVTLDLPGGALVIEEDARGHLLMSGPATHVFTGQADQAAFG